MGRRKHTRDRQDLRQIRNTLPIDLDELRPSSIVTPTTGRYKGIQFTVEGIEGFDGEEHFRGPEKPVKYVLWGYVNGRWVETIIPSTELKYLGKMPFEAWERRGRLYAYKTQY